MNFNKSTLSYLFVATSISILFSCQKVDFQKESGAFEAFAEMVHAGVKPIALSQPMNPAELDLFMPEANRLSEKYEISVYRESDLIGTSLFDSSVVRGKEVLILYKGVSLEAYQLLKNKAYELFAANEYYGEKKEEISRSFGRLLGYPESNINELLAQNSAFRDLEDFGIKGQELIWFYKDLPAAKKFYSEILGLKLLGEHEGDATFQIAGDSKLVLRGLNGSEYSGGESKSVALALLTDNLATWYAHLQKSDVEIKYTLKENAEGAHDGFVAVDPEGYLLEFEMFRMHPENEKFIPELKSIQPMATSLGAGFDFYASITWLYYRDMLPMENFMTQDLGLEMSADQGWAKIYRLSNNSYVGLVDEKRGMNSFSEEKLVEVKFDLNDPDGWEAYLKMNENENEREAGTFMDSGKYLFRF
jgi:catechol 2,3-dioxygenase-like lactoylglutathione lyase family enzyme